VQRRRKEKVAGCVFAAGAFSNEKPLTAESASVGRAHAEQAEFVFAVNSE